MLDRNILALTLLRLGIIGKCYSTIQALHAKSEVCIQVNDYLTDWCIHVLGQGKVTAYLQRILQYLLTICLLI